MPPRDIKEWSNQVSNPLRVGLSGFGFWAREAYVPTLQQLPSVRVTAVAARSSASRDAAREALGDDLTPYDDFRDLIENGDVDAVMIALPGSLHGEAVQAAVRSGRHVFFEPPIALTRETTDVALKTIAAASSVIQLDIELRYLPVMDAVADLIERGAIGPVKQVRISLRSDWGRDGALTHLGEEGIAYGLGPWYLDVLDSVIADMPRQAHVTGGYSCNGKLLDHGAITLNYEGGQVGRFELDLLQPEGLEVALHVLGGAGEIEANLISGDYRCRAADRTLQEGAAPPLLPEYGFVGMRESIAGFVNAIIEGHPSRTTFDVMRRVQEATLLCDEAENAYRQSGAAEMSS